MTTTRERSTSISGESDTRELAAIPPGGASTLLPMPAAAVIALRQPNAAFAAEEFFKPTSATNTPAAYGRIAGRFLSCCDERGLELRQIPPGLASEYISQLPGSAPTKNQALAALRHFFDAVVQPHVRAHTHEHRERHPPCYA